MLEAGTTTIDTPGGMPRAAFRQPFLFAFIAAATVAVLVASLAVVVGTRGSGKKDVDPAQAAAIEELWGIRVTRVAVTAGGGLIDFRYIVTNAEKAAAALAGTAHGHEQPTDEDLRTSPLLIDERTGFAVTEAQLHQTGRVQTERQSPQAGLQYPFFFNNTNGIFKPGGRASFAIGDVRLEHLAVQ